MHELKKKKEKKSFGPEACSNQLDRMMKESEKKKKSW